MSDSTNEKKSLTFGLKIKYSFFSALIFFLLSSPMMYQFMQNMYGTNFIVSDEKGCPSNQGLLLHTLIFFVLILITMLLG